MRTIRFPARALLAGVLALLLSFALVACGDDGGDDVEADGAGGAGETASCDDLDAVDAFVRLPADENTAAYVELTNNGDADTALVGASGDFAETFELHEMVADDEGVMTMQPIEGQSIALPAGETVVLEPGGLHVMGLGVTGELAEGDVVELTLEFEGGCTITLEPEVRAVDMPTDDMGGGDMSEGTSEEMGG